MENSWGTGEAAPALPMPSRKGGMRYPVFWRDVSGLLPGWKKIIGNKWLTVHTCGVEVSVSSLKPPNRFESIRQLFIRGDQHHQPLWGLNASHLLESGTCPELRDLVWSLKLKLLTCCSLYIPK